ncbi:cellulose synthase [Nocardioides lijunqiniae]|uniref:cellulose synthase n=1 Tax=Nocardioides lijunqiniae TaxID=2760832 RepID=UPI001878A400|nr:cellulose synthase [Nocardioides lijunqiniae]
MDDVTWGALAVVLTVVGGLYTWFAYRRRGLPAALKGAGLTLLPLAAYLTKTLRMLTRIGDAVADWATSLVFSPLVWVGIGVAGLAVVLFGAGRALEARSGGGRPRRATTDPEAPTLPPSGAPARGKPAIDDDMAEIEALLRKRGIS